MLLNNLLLPILFFSLNFFSSEIPIITNQALVQSSTTQLAQLQARRDAPTIPTQDFRHRYQATSNPLQTVLPAAKPTNTPTPTPTPKPTTTPITKPSPTPLTNTPATVQVDRNLNPQSLFNAINNYRMKKGVAALVWDQKLANYAQSRANTYQQTGSMDHHAGFKQLTSSSSGFYELGFRKLGENSSSGFSGNPVELVENLYARSAKHQENQLNPGWSHMGTGVSGGFTNIVFGGGKI